MIITVAPVTDARPQTPEDCGMFKFQRKILLIFGCWPPDRLTRLWYVKVLIAVNLITLAICIVGEFRYCLYAYQNGSLIETIESICPTVARFSGLLPIRLELEALAETVDKYTLKSSAAETLRINLELRRINKRHQTIIDVVSEVRHAFTPTILIMHICAAFMICIISMAMFLAEGINKLTYMPYTFTVLMLLFMYSYSGTIVRDSSEAIQTVAYGFPWYRFDRNTRHLVQMMMVRAKYGCNVDVPFFQTSMATFSVVAGNGAPAGMMDGWELRVGPKIRKNLILPCLGATVRALSAIAKHEHTD
uniref:Odorant receptor n=1 Tax=Anopheles coluzzii TaxID=1518534 RepID=A0A8W7PTN9_ANOCL